MQEYREKLIKIKEVLGQDLDIINRTIRQSSLAEIPPIEKFINKLKESNGRCHLLGLLSPGGVHSHSNHIKAIIEIFSKKNIPVLFHAFLDGRDTSPKSSKIYMKELLEYIQPLKNVSIATICGRYYGMDRDKRWNRTKKAYEAIANGSGIMVTDPLKAINDSYDKNITDEFIEPHIISDYKGIVTNDSLFMSNFRADRVRQILESLLNPKFEQFKRIKTKDFSSAIGLSEYSSKLKSYMDTVFTKELPRNCLGEIISREGLKQLRIAETEKYAHVTFFFNGGKEKEFEGEERIMIPSPNVKTYDMKPEMSAPEITKNLKKIIHTGNYQLIVVNYANGDMVGHTGILSAAIKAVEEIDRSLGSLEEAVINSGGTMIVTADHGNCELMIDPITKQPHTSHTTGEVPIVLIDKLKNHKLRHGRLADVAPTVLELMGIDQPNEMSGHSLIESDSIEGKSEKN